MNRLAALAIALLALGTAMPGGAKADVPGQVAASDTSASRLSPEVKRARLEQPPAKTYTLNGHRISVPADGNAQEMIKILKARFPALKPDAGAGTDDEFSIVD